MPLEVTEADIAERYGWTFAELDNEDQDRVYAAFAMQNIRDCIDRVKTWLESAGKAHISEHDMRIWGMIMDAEKELKEDNNGRG